MSDEIVATGQTVDTNKLLSRNGARNKRYLLRLRTFGLRVITSNPGTTIDLIHLRKNYILIPMYEIIQIFAFS